MTAYADRSAALALLPKPPRLCTHRAIQTRETTVTIASASASDEHLGDISKALRYREVDGLGVVERVVDRAAVEESVDQPAAGFGCTAKKVPVCPMPARTTSWPLGR